MNIVIIDDLQIDRDNLKFHINNYFRGSQFSVAMFESGEAFLTKFISGLYHIIFIDYYLGKISGMEVAQQIRMVDEEAVIIFTTMTSDFAIDGYKVGAAGYLLKPISYQSFTAALDVARIDKLHTKRFITLENGQERVNILLKDIIYCDIDGHYSQIHTNSKEIQRFRMPFQQLCQILEVYPEFYLCFRGCLINLEKVAKINELSIYMTNGDRIPFRKREYRKLCQLHQNFLFQKARRKI